MLVVRPKKLSFPLFIKSQIEEASLGISLSSIVDNIPVMFAVLSMMPDMSIGQWMLVTLTAGVGGSLLSIGSAAGVALMGQSRGMYTFFGHLKWTPAIAAGYAASIGAPTKSTQPKAAPTPLLIQNSAESWAWVMSCFWIVAEENNTFSRIVTFTHFFRWVHKVFNPKALLLTKECVLFLNRLRYDK